MDLFNKEKLLALEKEMSSLKAELKKLMSNKEEIKYLNLKIELAKLDNEIKAKKEYIKSLDYAIELKTKRSRELKGKLDKKELKMKRKHR